jgi:asparagine synthase (glutamine-hydrolysing)
MCGICGFATTKEHELVDAGALGRMRKALSHRGPDGEGSVTNDGVSLAHTRLSIIDVAGGQQPLANEDESVWITFNGEIYNYRTLMESLQAKGHSFRTRSDTEVLVHLYEERGPDMVRELNGMFAFAIHDRKRRRVLLARDHFGIKPLFYAVNGGVLYFGSEIKSVLAGTEAVARTSTRALHEYLLFRCVTGERTFFDGVKRLPPGCTAIWEDGHLSIHEYWRPPAPSASRYTHIEEAAGDLEQRLRASVTSQMVSEVPLGTYCSGGVDSGLTSLYAAQSTDEKLKTFSVGFDDPRWDETPLAQNTAARIGSEHHVLVADAEAYHDALPSLIWHHDEPLAHPNSVLIALLSKHARQFVTVVLTGEGADEIFGGYPRHHIVRANSAAQHLPMWTRTLIATILKNLGGRKGRMLAANLPIGFHEAIVMNSSFVSRDLVERLTGSSPASAIQDRVELAEALSVPGDPIASISRYDQRTYLPCLLDRMDRMTMATGLEGRVPFLDIGLAEWSSSVPSRFRLGLLENKRVVKQLGSRYLDQKITRGPKSGFGVPIGDWLRSTAWADFVERLRDPAHPASSLVDASVVRSLVKEHLSGSRSHAEVLWLLLNIFLWTEVQ